MSNPGVTFRVPGEGRRRLDELVKFTGKSLGQLLCENLGLQERSEEKTFEKGRLYGIIQGQNTLSSSCRECRRPIVIYLAADEWRLWNKLILTDDLEKYVCGNCARGQNRSDESARRPARSREGGRPRERLRRRR